MSRAAPQKIARVEHSGIGSHHDSVDLIGFDPALDFTVLSWLVEKLNRDMRPGDVILGAGRDARPGVGAADLRQGAYRLWTTGRDRRRYARTRRVHELRHARSAGRLGAWP